MTRRKRLGGNFMGRITLAQPLSASTPSSKLSKLISLIPDDSIRQSAETARASQDYVKLSQLLVSAGVLAP